MSEDIPVPDVERDISFAVKSTLYVNRDLAEMFAEVAKNEHDRVARSPVKPPPEFEAEERKKAELYRVRRDLAMAFLNWHTACETFAKEIKDAKAR